MSEIKVEELNYRKKQDVEETAKLHGTAFSGYPWFEHWPLEESLKEVHSWKALKKNGRGKVFVARAPDGRIIGLAVGHLHQPTKHSKEVSQKLGKGKHYYLRKIATHPDFLRRGIAKALTAARLKHAQKLNCTKVYGWTSVDNTPKIEQFEKEGFRDFHREVTKTGGVKSERGYYNKRLK